MSMTKYRVFLNGKGQRCVAYEAIPELERIAEAQNLPFRKTYHAHVSK